MEIICASRNKDYIFAVAGGEKPRTSFNELRLTESQLSAFITKNEYTSYLDNKYTYLGMLNQYASLYSFFLDKNPLIFYTAEGGECDTCLNLYLKYGQGQEPGVNDLADIRYCMDDYDGDIKSAIQRIENLMEIMFPKQLYQFKHCLGIMGDCQGNFTWNKYQKRSFLSGGSTMSTFRIIKDNQSVVLLLASQPVEAYSEVRVEYYRQQIRNGKRLGCIACEIENIAQYAIILDGHHRVLASMLEGVFPDCLMISPANYELSIRKEEPFLKLSPMHSKKLISLANYPEEIQEVLKNKPINKRDFTEKEILGFYGYYRDDSQAGNVMFPKEYESAAANLISQVLY